MIFALHAKRVYESKGIFFHFYAFRVEWDTLKKNIRERESRNAREQNASAKRKAQGSEATE